MGNIPDIVPDEIKQAIAIVFAQQQPKYDFQHQYKGYGRINNDSVCRVQIWMSADEKTAVCLFTNGTGTSVTNAAEQLIDDMVEKYFQVKPDRQHVIFMETYPENNGQIDMVFPNYDSEGSCRSVTWRNIGKLEF